MLKKEAAELVNHSSLATDPAIPDAVQRLQIQLSLVLHGHETHGWPLHSLGDSFGIYIVVLVGLHERSHILGWHQLHIVALLQKNTGEEVCTRTSFNANQAARQVHGKSDQLLAAEALLSDDAAFLAQANQVKHCLADINAANVNLHG